MQSLNCGPIPSPFQSNFSLFLKISLVSQNQIFGYRFLMGSHVFSLSCLSPLTFLTSVGCLTYKVNQYLRSHPLFWNRKWHGNLHFCVAALLVDRRNGPLLALKQLTPGITCKILAFSYIKSCPKQGEDQVRSQEGTW